jgi:hybrid cluster-associated redox disulfide protein
MRTDAAPTADMMVDNVMRRWPPTIRVFLDFRMLCVGCPIGAFHSIEEACGEHGIDASIFVSKLMDIAKAA